MTKRAFLVLGPESSGTRWLTRLLIKAGCAGSDDHVQSWDDALPEAEPLIVWRRSFPHGGAWPSVALMVNELQARGYEVTALVMVRDWFAMSRSQAKFQPTEIIDGNIRYAYQRIFAELTQTATPFVIMSYGGLVLEPEGFVNTLLGYFGLSRTLTADEIGAVNGNAKHYEGMGA